MVMLFTLPPVALQVDGAFADARWHQLRVGFAPGIVELDYVQYPTNFTRFVADNDHTTKTSVFLSQKLFVQSPSVTKSFLMAIIYGTKYKLAAAMD